jgi:hypothetical protein
MTLKIDGKQVSDYISFGRYLDIETRSMRYGRIASDATTRELGAFGYVMALLQVIGFSVGGVAVWPTWSQTLLRTLLALSLGEGQAGAVYGRFGWIALARVFEHIKNDALAAAIEQQKTFGNERHQKGDHLRSVFEIRHCKKCGRHWAKFSIEKRNGDGWKGIPELSVGGFTNAVVSL